MTFITRILLVALVLMVTAKYVEGIEITGWYPAVIAALVIGLFNALLRPILVILTLPITILSLGLFLLVINASLFLFAASFVDGFEVSGFLPALVGSLIVSIASTISNRFIA